MGTARKIFPRPVKWEKQPPKSGGVPPWLTLDTAPEDKNQAALFSFLGMAHSYGVQAAFDVRSWTVDGHSLHMLQTAGLGMTELQARQLRSVHAIPNGAELAKGGYGGALLKSTGLTPGIPDVFCPVPKQSVSGYYIELKAVRGVLNPAQQEMIPILRESGYRVDVLVGWRVVARSLFEYLEIRS